MRKEKNALKMSNEELAEVIKTNFEIALKASEEIAKLENEKGKALQNVYSKFKSLMDKKVSMYSEEFKTCKERKSWEKAIKKLEKINSTFSDELTHLNSKVTNGYNNIDKAIIALICNNLTEVFADYKDDKNIIDKGTELGQAINEYIAKATGNLITDRFSQVTFTTDAKMGFNLNSYNNRRNSHHTKTGMLINICKSKTVTIDTIREHIEKYPNLEIIDHQQKEPPKLKRIK